jgi:hypothetical protein
MQLLLEQLRRRVVELENWLDAELGPSAEIRIVRNADRDARRPDYDASHAPRLTPGGDWREAINTSVWLRFRLRRPYAWPVAETALLAQRFGTYPGEATRRVGVELQRMQGLLFLDGLAYHGLDQYHRLIHLPAGPHYQFAAREIKTLRIRPT